MKYGSSSFTVFMVDGISLLAAKLQGVTHKVDRSPAGRRPTRAKPMAPSTSESPLTQTGAFFDDGVNGMQRCSAGSPAERCHLPSTA